MAEEIVNRVAKSPLVSIDLDEYIDTTNSAYIDIKEGLFQELMLKEKEFREYVRTFNWDNFTSKNVAVFCSVDAIIPTWAYMLVATKLYDKANSIVLGTEEELEKSLIDQAIEKISRIEDLQNAKVVIKGCGNLKSRDYAYFELTKALLPKVSSLMYGEPCSTVPVFKKKLH